MGLHLKKLCVGCENILELRTWQQEFCKKMADDKKLQTHPQGLILPYHDTP